MSLELAAKHVEMLKRAVPSALRLAVLTNPAHPGERSEREEATLAAAQSLGLAAQVYEIRTIKDFASAFDRIVADKCDCLLAFPETLTLSNRKAIGDFVLERKLPSLSRRPGLSNKTGALGL
jgi:putative ABC transport system substrate-binding protein